VRCRVKKTKKYIIGNYRAYEPRFRGSVRIRRHYSISLINGMKRWLVLTPGSCDDADGQ
jgi:hypothetical protein